MEQHQPYRILFKKNPDGSASICRMYGTSPQVMVPEKIAGHPVTEIAPYCFAGIQHLPKEEILEENISDSDTLTVSLQELSGISIESVVLPDSVTKIGTYAFYNCKNLKTLQIGTGIEDIGSDAFMNTLSLREIILRGLAGDKSGIRQILTQISADIEVQFGTGQEIEAILLYPEYYESYDEIAPAHLFGRNITGEGFRARQCFKDGKVDFAGYDAIFLQACVEESEATLTRMALNRIRYPYALQKKYKEEYERYLKEHIQTIGIRLTKEKELEILQFLCQESVLGGANLAKCIEAAADANWPEGAASLLHYQAAMGTVARKNRYNFDEF